MTQIRTSYFFTLPSYFPIPTASAQPTEVHNVTKSSGH